MLQSLIFSILLAACGGQEAESEAESPVEIGQEISDYSATGEVGSACRMDSECQGDFLFCDLTLPGMGGTGMCSQTCIDQPDTDAEVDVCGGEEGATCLSWAAESGGFCTQSCEVDADPGELGACAEGQVCTGNGLYREPDAAGCAFFCQADEHCGPYRSCDARTGECVELTATDRSALLPDGSACDPNAYDERGRSTECRGICLPISGRDGLCASLIDLAVTQTCPDDPERISPASFDGDNQAFCAFIDCASDDDCTGGTTCEFCPLGGRCCMP